MFSSLPSAHGLGTAKTLISPYFSCAPRAQPLESSQHTSDMQVTRSSATALLSLLQVPSIVAIETTFSELLHVALLPLYRYQRLRKYNHAPTAQLAADGDHLGRAADGSTARDRFRRDDRWSPARSWCLSSFATRVGRFPSPAPRRSSRAQECRSRGDSRGPAVVVVGTIVVSAVVVVVVVSVVVMGNLGTRLRLPCSIA